MEYGPIEIFRAGTWTDMAGKTTTFAASDLAAIVASYDPNSAPAPAVIGHPKNDAPAYGWVASLAIEGDKLTAVFKDAAAEFVEWVKAGRYRKVSISLFMPGMTSNPKPDDIYLKHVGFLGGAAPAVAGLAPVGFSANPDGFLCFEDDRVQAHRDALLRRVEELRLEKLMDEGRLLPFFKGELVTFMDSLDGEGVYAFSDGARMSQRDWLWSYLERQPPVVNFSELPKGDRFVGSRQSGRHQGKHPSGYAVSDEGAELFAEASQLAETSGISFAAAVRRLTEGA